MALTPSQRVTLIKEIGRRLGKESYSLIDITLQQFGVRTIDEWGGTAEGYVLRLISDANDQVLVDLGQHVGYRFEQPETPRIEPAFWRNNMLRLFLSHLAVNKKFAGELRDALLPYGISAFVAHTDIEPTLEWQVQIETALSTCEALVALLHDKFHASNWTDQEIVVECQPLRFDWAKLHMVSSDGSRPSVGMGNCPLIWPAKSLTPSERTNKPNAR